MLALIPMQSTRDCTAARFRLVVEIARRAANHTRLSTHVSKGNEKSEQCERGSAPALL
jgi:hypothetical protein